MREPYVLLAPLGTSPGVLTETVWSLAQDGLVPATVHVMTTATGWEVVAGDLGFETENARWDRLSRGVCGLDRPIPVERHVVRGRNGRELRDIRHEQDDLAFGAACYALVRRLTEATNRPPVVGSIAGGRKTMSAHLMTAFCLCARQQDRLVHVLISSTF